MTDTCRAERYIIPRLTESPCADRDACAPRESGAPRSASLPANQRPFRGGGLKRILSLLVLLALLPLSFALSESTDPVIINEVMASNGTYTNGHAYDWLELYNPGKKAYDLSGCWLSNDPDEPQKWQFPAGSKLGGGKYFTVYCTGEAHDKGKNSTYYTDFKISAKGATLMLTAADGETLITRLYVPRQYGTVSWGLPKGGSEYLFLATETPGKENPKKGYTYRCDTPVLSLPGGLYEKGKITVTASGAAGDTLRYTTDGSTPTEKSKKMPESGVVFSSTGCIRVRAFNEKGVPSATASATYLMGEEHPVPVICLISDDKYLFNSKTGALVKGTGSTPNYEKELEYPANIEYFDEEGACLINQVGTFTAAGHSARQNTQKSIAVYARNAYGEDLFHFNPFPRRDYDSYKSLLLRGANSDAFSTRMRDCVYTSLSDGLGLIYQDGIAVEVYINGKYWGHYNLREKINKHFVAAWEGVTDEDEIDRIDILARSGSDQFVQNGDNADWLELVNFCKTKDLNVPENLAYVEERLDIDSLFTHAAYEIILGNGDFTNVRMYRVPGGKWKYLLFDVEAGFNNDEWNADPIGYYIRPVSGKYQGFRHEPLNALLAVPEMKARFLTRYAEILEKCFLWPVMDAKFTEWEDTLRLILPRHIARWKNLKMTAWEQNVNAVKNHARRRPAVSVLLLQKAMKLTDDEMRTYFGPVMRELVDTNFSEKEKKSFFGKYTRWWEE